MNEGYVKPYCPWIPNNAAILKSSSEKVIYLA